MIVPPIQVFDSVLYALEGTPDEADNMRCRSDLAIAIRIAVEGWETATANAAERLGVAQPRLDDLLRGNSIDSVSWP